MSNVKGDQRHRVIVMIENRVGQYRAWDSKKQRACSSYINASASMPPRTASTGSLRKPERERPLGHKQSRVDA